MSYIRLPMASSQCPNNDPYFDQAFSRWTDITADTYPAWRRRTYYTVCIPVRLTIAFAVYLLRNQPWLPYVVGVVALGSVLNLGSQIIKRECVARYARRILCKNRSDPPKYWWSKRFQLFVSALLLMFSLDMIYGISSVPNSILAYTILFSIVGGLVQSFMYPSC